MFLTRADVVPGCGVVNCLSAILVSSVPRVINGAFHYRFACMAGMSATHCNACRGTARCCYLMLAYTTTYHSLNLSGHNVWHPTPCSATRLTAHYAGTWSHAFCGGVHFAAYKLRANFLSPLHRGCPYYTPCGACLARCAHLLVGLYCAGYSRGAARHRAPLPLPPSVRDGIPSCAMGSQLIVDHCRAAHYATTAVALPHPHPVPRRRLNARR